MISEADLELYCLNKPGVEKTFPFGPDTAVMKVLGKMFALYSPEDDGVLSVNLKADPDWSLILREHYEAVRPGYHMNKKHWNTVRIDGSIPNVEVWEMVDHSYNLVVKKLPKSEREKLAAIATQSGSS